MKKPGLTNNQLKLIAMLTMTVDHVGLLLFPRIALFRYIGRLAFPIYAFMIAEGCRHTRSMRRYLGSMAVLAALCQVVSFAAQQSLQQSILVTFTFSIGLIWLVKRIEQRNTAGSKLCFCIGLLVVLGITEVLPSLLPRGDFSVDYGFIGVVLPVCVYMAKTRPMQLSVCGLLLALLACTVWPGQWLALLALPLLALYNGQRGKWRLKWLFYLYYPAHLAIIWLIAILF